MGAVGAAATTDFEKSSFCTINYHTKIPLAIVFGTYLKICTHSFEMLTRFLKYNVCIMCVVVRLIAVAYVRMNLTFQTMVVRVLLRLEKKTAHSTKSEVFEH